MIAHDSTEFNSHEDLEGQHSHLSAPDERCGKVVQYTAARRNPCSSYGLEHNRSAVTCPSHPALLHGWP